MVTWNSLDWFAFYCLCILELVEIGKKLYDKHWLKAMCFQLGFTVRDYNAFSPGSTSILIRLGIDQVQQPCISKLKQHLQQGGTFREAQTSSRFHCHFMEFEINIQDQ